MSNFKVNDRQKLLTIFAEKAANELSLHNALKDELKQAGAEESQRLRMEIEESNRRIAQYAKIDALLKEAPEEYVNYLEIPGIKTALLNLLATPESPQEAAVINNSIPGNQEIENNNQVQRLKEAKLQENELKAASRAAEDQAIIAARLKTETDTIIKEMAAMMERKAKRFLSFIRQTLKDKFTAEEIESKLKSLFSTPENAQITLDPEIVAYVVKHIGLEDIHKLAKMTAAIPSGDDKQNLREVTQQLFNQSAEAAQQIFKPYVAPDGVKFINFKDQITPTRDPAMLGKSIAAYFTISLQNVSKAEAAIKMLPKSSQALTYKTLLDFKIRHFKDLKPAGNAEALKNEIARDYFLSLKASIEGQDWAVRYSGGIVVPGLNKGKPVPTTIAAIYKRILSRLEQGDFRHHALHDFATHAEEAGKKSQEFNFFWRRDPKTIEFYKNFQDEFNQFQQSLEQLSESETESDAPRNHH